MKLSGLLILPLLQAVLLVEASLRLTPPGPELNHNLNNADSPILMRCLYPADGSGGSGMTWWKDGSQLSSAGRITLDEVDNGKELSIQPVEEGDAGIYTCKANVDGQESSASITVNTYYGIKVVSPVNQYPVKGTDGKILCENAKPNANIEVKWYRHIQGVKTRIGSQDVKYSFDNTNLIIRNIQLEDTGIYTCQLNMPTVGDALNFRIDVTVTMIPVFSTPITVNPPNPKEGDRLVMTCKAEGIPEPRYTFNKRNAAGSFDPVAEETNGEYIVANLTRQNEGEYQCLAANKAGSAVSVTQLDVSIPPKITEASDPITGQEGNRVAVDCVAVGKPPPFLSWRHDGSPNEYSSSPNEEVYVERSAGEPQLDAETKVYRTTLTLVFRNIKASHAGTYNCEANSAAGQQTVPFEVDVTYKPNFLEQHVSQYWGWTGSNTNVTCVANGNPAPVIRWFKGDKLKSTERGDHIVVQNPPPSRTKTVSYLFPKPQEDNTEVVFGEYVCEAENRFGSNRQTLHFVRAEVPAEPTVQITSSRPTELALAVAPPPAENNGGQEVTRYVILWRRVSPAEDYRELTVDRNMQEQTTQVLIRDLTPNTQYSIKAKAVNNVGPGNEATILDKTQDVSKPDPPVVMSTSSGSLANSYSLEWRVPMTGGAEITNYVIEYKQILEADTTKDKWEIKRACTTCPAQTIQVVGQYKTVQELTGLIKDTYYSASISAVNRIGSSDPTVFVFRTGKGGESSVKEDENDKMAAESDYDYENPDEDLPIKEQGNEPSTVSSHGHVIPGSRVALSSDEAGTATLGAGAIVGILIIVFLVLFIAIDAAFYKTKSCGLVWALCTVFRRQEPGGDVAGKRPEEGDEAATKLLGKEKDDSLRTENEVAKETEPVEETGEREEKKELEPEDKEEKPVTEVKTEEPPKEKVPEVEVTAATEAPAEPEPTPHVETKPTEAQHTDATANA